jgi:hypothetical protein
MAHPQVADGGDSLQIWRVDANILNKQWRIADRGWSSSWGLGRGLTTPTVKPLICYEKYARALDQDKGRDRWRAVVNAVMDLRVLAPQS